MKHALLIALVIALGIWLLRDHVPYLGKLPGDLFLEFGQFGLYAPFTSTILILLIISWVRSLSR